MVKLMPSTGGLVPKVQGIGLHGGRRSIGALRHDRPHARWVIGGPINSDICIEIRLAPTLLAGDVIAAGCVPRSARYALVAFEHHRPHDHWGHFH